MSTSTSRPARRTKARERWSSADVIPPYRFGDAPGDGELTAGGQRIGQPVRLAAAPPAAHSEVVSELHPTTLPIPRSRTVDAAMHVAAPAASPRRVPSG